LRPKRRELVWGVVVLATRPPSHTHTPGGSSVFCACVRAQEDCFLSTVLPNPEVAIGFVKDLLSLCIALSDKRLFRDAWLVFDLVLQVQLVKVLSWVGRVLSCGLRSDSVYDDDGEEWQLFFELGLLLLTSPTLSLETLSAEKRQLVEDKYGDLRPHVCAVLRSAWGPSSAPHHSLLFDSVATMLQWSGESALGPQPDSLCAARRLALCETLVAPCMQLTYRCVGWWEGGRGLGRGRGVGGQAGALGGT
jgi:hypothetical protein